MSNIPKPELERGNYIAYADEPNTIVDNAGGGGGGGGGGVVALAGTINEDEIISVSCTYSELLSYLNDSNAVFLICPDWEGSGYAAFMLKSLTYLVLEGVYEAYFDDVRFESRDANDAMQMT